MMVLPQISEFLSATKRPIKTNYQQEINRTYNKRAVSFTRVSTKKQEANTSIQSQINFIKKFARESDYNIVAEFGGKSESAKDTDGKEYKNLLAFVKNKRNNINNILVCDLDRFSRAGTGVINELREKYNVQVIDVRNPREVKTYVDIYAQNSEALGTWRASAGEVDHPAPV